MSKQVWLVTPGADDAAVGQEASIDEDTTARDVLQAAEKDPAHWQLQLQRDGKSVSFSSQDKIYEQVKDREKIYLVATDMIVGSQSE